MKILKFIFGNFFASLAFVIMLISIPIGFVYGAARRGFQRGKEIGEDPIQLIQ